MTGKSKRAHGWRHRLFQVAVVFKGLDGLLEIVAGVALLVFGVHKLNHMIASFVQSEFSEDHDFVAHLLTRHGHPLKLASVHFAAFYLLAQGGVKLWLVEALLRERPWVFPVALVLIGLLSLYIAIRLLFVHASLGLGFLLALNLIVMLLIWREYQDVR